MHAHTCALIHDLNDLVMLMILIHVRARACVHSEHNKADLQQVFTKSASEVFHSRYTAEKSLLNY